MSDMPTPRPRFAHDERMFTLRELLLYGLVRGMDRDQAEAEAAIKAVARERGLDLKEALPFWAWDNRQDVMAALGDAVVRTAPR